MESNKDFRKTYKDFILSSKFMVVFLLTLTQTVIIGYFQIYIKGEAYNDQQSLQVALFSFAISLIFSAVLKAHCSYHMGKDLGLILDKDMNRFLQRIFVDWIVMEIRTQLRVLVGLCLFIIPGIIEALRLSLAIPMVFYDKRMKDLKFDPVVQSRDILHLKNPVLFTLFTIVILAPTLLHLALQNGSTPLFETHTTMIIGGLSSLVFALFTSFTYLYFTFLYKNTVSNSPSKTGEI